jgi:sporulation protein YlmC with PRC-barrel domain
MNWIATLLGVSLMMSALPTASAVAQQPSATSPQAILVGSDSLVGGTVRDSEGRDIGKVSRLMIDPNDGRVTSMIIATGGTLGVGSNTISVPWSSVKIGQDRGKLVVTASQTLESAPGRASAPP